MAMRSVSVDAGPVFLTKKPTGPLGALVEMCWLWRGDPPAHQRDRMLPTGTASFIVNLADDELRIYDNESGALARRFEGSGFDGAHLTPFVIDTAEQVYVAGVEFRPGGVRTLSLHRGRTGEPTGARQETPACVADLLGPDAGTLGNRVENGDQEIHRMDVGQAPLASPARGSTRPGSGRR